MARSRIHLMAAAVIVLAIVYQSKLESAAPPQTEKPVPFVRASEIGNQVQLIGRLGAPMAQLVELQGYWVEAGDSTKTSRYAFRVVSVGGKLLKLPVEFSQHVVEFGPGGAPAEEDMNVTELWSCRAVEVGQFRNVIARHWKAFYDQPVSPPNWGDGPFVSELIIAKKSLRRTRRE